MSCQDGRAQFQADLGSHPSNQGPGVRHSGLDRCLQSFLPCDHPSLLSALEDCQDRAILCLTDGETEAQGEEEAWSLLYLSLFGLES